MSNCNAERVNANIRVYASAVESTTSLHLLNLVDETIDALVSEQNIVSGHVLLVEDLIERVQDCQNENETEIDPEDKIHELLLSVETNLRARYAECKVKIGAAKNDNLLNGNHEDDIITEYKSSMSIVNKLYDANEQLRLAIMEFDADLSPVSDSFDNADDLIAELNS